MKDATSAIFDPISSANCLTYGKVTVARKSDTAWLLRDPASHMACERHFQLKSKRDGWLGRAKIKQFNSGLVALSRVVTYVRARAE